MCFPGWNSCSSFVVIASWNRTAVDLTQKEKHQQPKCTCRVFCRLNRASSSAFLISQGSNRFSLFILHWCVLNFTFMSLFSVLIPPSPQCHRASVFIHFFCITSWIWWVGSQSLLWWGSKLVKIMRIWARFAFLSDFSYNLYSFLILKDEQRR